MKRTLLLIVCAALLLLCACTPHKSEEPETTPAATEPQPSPGITIIVPVGTPGEYIDPADPSEGPVILPIETPAPTTEDTNVSNPEPTPNSTPNPTPESTAEPTPKPTEDGIKLPYVPVGPK